MPARSSVLGASLLLLLQLLPHCLGIALTEELEPDREALIALQMAITDPGRSKVATWKATGNPCCPKPWRHLTCSNGRVATLNLAHLRIEGTLPSELRQLNGLSSLILDGNKFTGSLPDDWADPDYFLSLQTLNLARNQLTGPLPNRKWNVRGGWRALEELDLSDNSFYGGLPDGWLSTAKVFRNLVYLDLSQNYLGYSDAGETPLPNWCLAGSQESTGWCPSSVPLAGTMAKLEVLDLSANGFTGALPARWPRIFPRLNSLSLHTNQFTAAPGAGPALLPAGWTRTAAPKAFPELSSLVLYPGNDRLCFLPDADGSGYLDVAGGASYLVEDEDGQEYEAGSPWYCLGPEDDNPPTISQLVQGPGRQLSVAFAAPAAPDTPAAVFGYRVSIWAQDSDTEEWHPRQDWTGRLLRIYAVAALPAGLTGGGTAGGYVLDTGFAMEAGVVYKVGVSSWNMDGTQSTLATKLITCTA